VIAGPDHLLGRQRDLAGLLATYRDVRIQRLVDVGDALEHRVGQLHGRQGRSLDLSRRLTNGQVQHVRGRHVRLL
jgi:hypothetical protein